MAEVRNSKVEYDHGRAAGEQWAKAASRSQLRNLAKLGRRFKGRAFPVSLATAEAVYDYMIGPGGKRPSFEQFDAFWDQHAGKGWRERLPSFWQAFVDACDAAQADLDVEAQEYRDRMATVDQRYSARV